MPLQLDYYYGGEAEQYSFYRIPKLLFTDSRFKGVSVEAKVLYSLLLDRMALSMRNGWLDGEGRVYIIFTIAEVMGMLDCAEQKANKLLNELDCVKGVGLIERRRRGAWEAQRDICQELHRQDADTVCAAHGIGQEPAGRHRHRAAFCAGAGERAGDGGDAGTAIPGL